MTVLFIAGIGGGLAGSIAGLASVATYPALLAVGLPPVSANITNTVAMIFSGVGSAWGSRPELRGQSAAIKRLIPAAAVGAGAGAALLLSLPAKGFENLIPIVIGASAVLIALPRRPPRQAVQGGPAQKMLQSVAILAICVQSGFFGAAAGVLLLALFLGMGSRSLASANAAKNVVMGVANSVAALVFVILAPIDWFAVITLGCGCLIGARLGPTIVRHAPATPLRLAIAAAGMALAIALGLSTYAPSSTPCTTCSAQQAVR